MGNANATRDKLRETRTRISVGYGAQSGVTCTSVCDSTASYRLRSPTRRDSSGGSEVGVPFARTLSAATDSDAWSPDGCKKRIASHDNAHARMQVYVYVCIMYVDMHVCMYVYRYVYIGMCMYRCMYV